MEYIYELICLSEDEHGHSIQEFNLGYYSDEAFANEQKEECERQSREDNIALEYEVRRHRIIQKV